MINITFPDGTIKQFEQGITGFNVAKSISESLAKNAMLVEVNGELWDLSRPINQDANIRIFTDKNPECLDTIRHDAAHILAMAVKELFPEAQVTIGPAIKDGFYYDFSVPKPFSADDLPKIEEKMYEIVKRDNIFERQIWKRDEAVEFFRSIGEFYKADIISSIPQDQDITIYKQGDFMDLCRGPHSPSTGRIKYFKLTKLAGAYWRGDSKNEMLQRVYGTAWDSKANLEQYLTMIEEAEKRDHRKIGRELDLFHFQEEAQGMVFWHKKGWSVYRVIENYIRSKIEKAGYFEVRTPMLVDKSLWEASGHWEKFREDMFALESDEKTFALKPMSCPCHVQIFKQGTKSYRDLPLRMAEFGCCHRNEASGGLHGLMRVRNFVQDDAHIFCTEDQITSETLKFCQLLTEIYRDFGFEDIIVKFSDRAEKRAGSDQVWDKAERALKAALEEAGFEYILNPGEGAFYGPKLEFVLRDAIGRDWQCGTLQVDYIIPERLDASYIDSNGEKQRPVMLHRAVIGTFERFIGILIEQYAGRFPLWLAPVQVAIVTITNDVDDYAKQVYSELMSESVRAELDISNEKVNYKIRHFSNQKVPIIAIIGKNEMQQGVLTLRFLGQDEQKIVKVSELIDSINEENSKYLGHTPR